MRRHVHYMCRESHMKGNASIYTQANLPAWANPYSICLSQCRKMGEERIFSMLLPHLPVGSSLIDYTLRPEEKRNFFTWQPSLSTGQSSNSYKQLNSHLLTTTYLARLLHNVYSLLVHSYLYTYITSKPGFVLVNGYSLCIPRSHTMKSTDRALMAILHEEP